MYWQAQQTEKAQQNVSFYLVEMFVLIIPHVNSILIFPIHSQFSSCYNFFLTKFLHSKFNRVTPFTMGSKVYCQHNKIVNDK